MLSWSNQRIRHKGATELGERHVVFAHVAVAICNDMASEFLSL
jgi:hypothetical protein